MDNFTTASNASPEWDDVYGFINFVRERWRARGHDVTIIEFEWAEDAPVEARIDHGRWLADCECGGAELVDFDHPVFYCFSCQNLAVGHRLRPVVVPEERDEIEIALRPRQQRNRNWRPGESIMHLHAENREHGLESEGR